MSSGERLQRSRSRGLAAGLVTALAVFGPASARADEARPTQALTAFGLWSRAEPPAGLPLALFTLSDTPRDAYSVPLPRSLAAGDPFAWGDFRYRRVHVIRYSTPLRVARNDLLMRIEAPGAGRAILSCEFVY